VDFLFPYSLSHKDQPTRWTSYRFIHSAIEVNQHGGLLILYSLSHRVNQHGGLLILPFTQP